MTESTDEENRQFEQVLSRLDALMKRSQAAPAPVEPPEVVAPGLEEPSAAPVEAPMLGTADADDGIPVLTEVYDGVPVSTLAEARQELPFVLLDTGDQPAVEPQSVPEADAESIVAELMPLVREAIERSIREELARAQQALQLRLPEEMEQALRQRLLLEIKPK